jgi:hypothetical protein
VAAVERDGAAQKRDRAAGLLVAQDLGVGEAGGVVDGDVDVVPAGLATDAPSGVGVGACVVLAGAGDALAGAADDPTEFLDVDVDQLAGPGAFIALRGLEAEPAQLAHPGSGQDARDRRQRPVEQLGDLGAGQAQPSQRRDRLDRPLVGAVGDAMRRRAAIQQTAL